MKRRSCHPSGRHGSKVSRHTCSSINPPRPIDGSDRILARTIARARSDTFAFARGMILRRTPSMDRSIFYVSQPRHRAIDVFIRSSPPTHSPLLFQRRLAQKARPLLNLLPCFRCNFRNKIKLSRFLDGTRLTVVISVSIRVIKRKGRQ